MGKSYYVPRSVKGESRLLYIFTIKSFITTIVVGLLGAGIWYIGGTYFGMGLVPGIIITAIFGALGFCFGALKIPDIPMMGAFRKAGGENISDIVFRFLTFKRKKKIYIYNLNRKVNKGGN